VRPSTRYLVFQLIDEPRFYHITADLAQSAFIALFGLTSCTMYHLYQSLTLCMINSFKSTEAEVIKKIRIYNTVISGIVFAYFATFLVIFLAFDVPVEIVLVLDLVFRGILMTFYVITVCYLFRTLKNFPSGLMSYEINSVKRQFFSFLFGFAFQAFYSSYQISQPTTSFTFECINTVVNIFSFDIPIMVVMYAHYQTFRGFRQHLS
jgi:hypothetical protein